MHPGDDPHKRYRGAQGLAEDVRFYRQWMRDETDRHVGPHPDVLANRFKESESAADLFAVASGNADGDYATPRDFFGITSLAIRHTCRG